MDSFDPETFLPYLLNRAAETSSLGFARIYKDRYGLLRTDWRVLFHLGHYGNLTARDISQRAGIHKTKISRSVARLETRRFLIRQRDADDKRFEDLQLTTAGRAAYDDLSKEAARYDAQLTRNMDEKQVEALRTLLRHLSD